MPKFVVFDEESRQALERGINALATTLVVEDTEATAKQLRENETPTKPF